MKIALPTIVLVLLFSCTSSPNQSVEHLCEEVVDALSNNNIQGLEQLIYSANREMEEIVKGGKLRLDNDNQKEKMMKMLISNEDEKKQGFESIHSRLSTLEVDFQGLSIDSIGQPQKDKERVYVEVSCVSINEETVRVRVYYEKRNKKYYLKFLNWQCISIEYS